MIVRLVLCAFALSMALAAADIRYTDDGKLMLPSDYREWVFLNSGLGMTYGPAADTASVKHPFFDNVYVNRDSYRAFLDTGHWPDKTILILEIRRSASHESINNGGHFQTDLATIEAAVKDESRNPDKWAYYNFGTPAGTVGTAASALPKNAGCFACHTTNAAVENTFVQFYPTLYEVAVNKGTLNEKFVRPSPTPNMLSKLIATQGWDAGRKAIEAAAQKDPDTPIAEEQNLNLIGYQLMGAGKNKEAVELLAWVAVKNPASANAQDSLADAYMAAGDTANAKAATEKALALLQTDTSISANRKQRVEQALKDRLAKLK